MPWGKRKTASGEWQVYKKITGKAIGPTYSSEAKADKYLAALHANVSDMERGASTMAKSIHKRGKG